MKNFADCNDRHRTRLHKNEAISASFSAEISVRSPRNYLILLSKKIFLDQNIHKIIYLILKKEALEAMREQTMKKAIKRERDVCVNKEREREKKRENTRRRNSQEKKRSRGNE